MYLVDTSVWVDYLRAKGSPQVQALRSLLAEDEVVGVTPIIVQEILQGADSEDRFEKWRSYFTDLCAYTFADPTASHVAAARLYFACRRRGRTPRSSNDCLIAQAALEHGLVLLHSDRDFDAIARVAPSLQTYPV